MILYIKKLYGSRVTMMIKIREEEKEFLKEFTTLMMDGIIIKKYSRYFGYVFRRFYIKPEEYLLCWDSKKRDKEFIQYKRIIELSKKVEDIPFKVSKEMSTRYLILKIDVENKLYDPHKKYILKRELNYKKYIKKIILEFVNSYSCEMFYDGFQLLLIDYKNRMKELEHRSKRKSILRRILTDENLRNSSDEED